VKQWRPPIVLSIYHDEDMNLFNDNVQYHVQTFDDVVRLNASLTVVAMKYGWLDPIKLPPVLRKFLGNLEVVQTLLGDLEGKLVGAANDGMDEINAEVIEISERLRALNNRVFMRNMTSGPQYSRVSKP
jgi:hypothetical protein